MLRIFVRTLKTTNHRSTIFESKTNAHGKQTSKWIRDLPRLPVPSLQSTVDKYLEILKSIQRPQDSIALINECESKLQIKTNSLIRSSIDSAELIKLNNQYDNTTKIAAEFIEFEGTYLQKLLVSKAKQSNNWASDIYVNFYYLQNRASLVYSSSAFFLHPKLKFRSANELLLYSTCLIEFAIDFRNKISNETLKQEYGRGVNKGMPLCMDYYKPLFHSCRIPRQNQDELYINKSNVDHIVVSSCNQFFILRLGNDDYKNLTTNILSTRQIYENLGQIYSISRMQARKFDQPKVGILTTEDRDNWSAVYEKLNLNNKRSIELIQTALFVLCLDSNPNDSNEELEVVNQNELSETSKSTINKNLVINNWREICKEKTHPNFDSENEISNVATFAQTCGGSNMFAANRWFDKPMQLVVGMKACGYYLEHSTAEGGLPISFLTNFMSQLASESKNEQTFNKHIDLLLTKTSSFLSDNSGNNTTTSTNFKQINWLLDDNIHNSIEKACKSFDETAIQKSTVMLQFDDYGSEFIKSKQISPDAFIQLAFLLVEYERTKRLAIPMAACMMRKFKFGRYESIHANTLEALAWIQAMQQLNEFKNKVYDDTNDRIFHEDHLKQKALLLLKRALKKHADVTANVVNGNGIDIHLIALSELAQLKLKQMPNFFVDKSMQKLLSPNFLCTSVSNNSGITLSCNNGFYDDDLYAVAYNVNSKRLEFYISLGNKNMDGTKYAQRIKDSLIQMGNLIR